jgi:DNA mismatch repair protein MutS
MFKIDDLNIENDILPLFNYTNNYKSELKILEILKSQNLNIETILERQQILKGFIVNCNVLEGFTYHRLTFMEITSFFENLTKEKVQPAKGKINAVISLYFFQEEKARLYSRHVQLILFLDNFHKRYFSPINLLEFPDSYKVKFKEASRFIGHFNLTFYIKIIKENKFSIRRIIEFSRILGSISKKEVDSFFDFFHQFEAYYSISRAIKKHNFCFPSFDNNSFLLEDFYHPSLNNPVKNSLSLNSDKRVVVLTGPNMSGKSTFLRSVGLCILLSNVGLAIPASKCSLPFFESISISINSSDSLQNGYSQFMMEIQNVKSIVTEASLSRRCFAVFDELFKGTNIDDAQDISLTTINGLTQFKNSYFFISTHLVQIEDLLSDIEPDIIKLYIDCDLVNSIPQFNYKVKEGWSNLKIGKILFNLEGLGELLKIHKH